MSEQDQNFMPVAADVSTSAFDLVMNDAAMERMMATANLMASAKVTIPKHLQNSPGDCMAVIMQAAQWKMNPFAVAQKTHLSQSGQLGYESQLINAVIVGGSHITGQPYYEFIGDWSKILGKVVEKVGQNGGKYFAASWDKKDEEGLGVKMIATLRGESASREMTVMLSQCYPRFSTQWATDPQQQICYLILRKFSRRYCPGAILGCYDIEELDTPPMERELNPMPSSSKPANGKDAAERAKFDKKALTPAEERRRKELITKLEEAAGYGFDAYSETWKKLPTADREMVGSDDHKRMATMSRTINGTATVVNEDGGGNEAKDPVDQPAEVQEPGANG